MAQFAVTCQCGQARTATLSTSQSTMTTPMFLLYTHRAVCPWLTPDHVQMAVASAPVAVSLANAHECFPDPLLAKEDFDLHNFFAAKGQTVLVTLHDALQIPPSSFSNKKSVSVIGEAGRKVVSIKTYADWIGRLKADLYCSLADVPSNHSTEKQRRQAVSNTIRWLDELLEQPGVAPAQILGTVMANGTPEQCHTVAEHVAAKPVGGFAIVSPSIGQESQDHDMRVAAAVSGLPSDKVRYLQGVNMPEDILRAVALGIDLFDSTYPVILTENGLAALWVFGEREVTIGSVEESEAAIDNLDIDPPRKINLWDTAYQNDQRPIMKGCQCYTCTTHMRAYVHHLLVTHEMLAEVLLFMHNLHHFECFFKAIGQSVTRGTLSLDTDLFHQRYSANQL